MSMPMPQGPPPQVGPQGAMPPQGAPPQGLPPQAMQALQTAIAALPPEIQQIVQQMPVQMQVDVLTSATPQEAIAKIAAFAQSIQGPAGLVGPNGAPIGGPQQGPPPGALPPAPPGVLPGGPQMQPPPVGGPLPPQPGTPPLPPVPPGMPLPAPPKPPEPEREPEPLLRPDEDVDSVAEELPDRAASPEWELPPLPKNLYGSEGPSVAMVEADAQMALRRYKERDEAERLWHDMYYQQNHITWKPGQLRKNPYRSESLIPTTQTTMADRAIGLVAPEPERMMYKSQPPDDSAVSRDANQAKRNAARTIYEQVCRIWTRRVSNDGHIRPSVPRVLGGTMVIEGSMPALIDMNPKNKQFPWTFEPLPVHEVYPMGHATLRIFYATLGELRSAYPDQINKAYPLSPEGPTPDEEQRFMVVGWSDELWHGIWASISYSGAGSGKRRRTEEERRKNGVWLKPMRRHNNGWRVYQYGLPALGSPIAPTGEEVLVEAAHGVRSIYAGNTALFQLQARVLQATAEGAFKAVRPPYKMKLANPNDTAPEIDDAPGGKGVTLKPGEDIEPMLSSLMDTKAGQSLLEFIGAMLGEVMPPVTSGRGQAASGADRFIAQQQAAALHIDPIISGIEATLSYYVSLMIEGFYRKSRGSKSWLQNLPIRQHSRPPEEEAQGGGVTLALLLPDDIARCGPEVTIKYKRWSVAERMQLGAFLKNMVDAKFMSRMDAMDELDVDDYERTLARQLVEAVYEDPDMVKASIDALIEEQIDPPLDSRKRAARRAVRINRAWRRRQMQQTEPQGSPPAERGMPSPAAMPGDAATPGMPSPDMMQ